MISLDLTQFCFWTLTVLLAIVAAVWLSSNMVRRIREHKAERNNIRCSVCGCVFPAASEAHESPTSSPSPPACPRCGSLNEHNKIIIF